MKTVKLSVEKRADKVSAKELRSTRRIPAVIYGRGKENLHLDMDYQDFRKAFNEAGSSTILDVEIEGVGHEKAIVHDVQYDSMTDQMTHVDFVYVNMNEKITTEIRLEFVGTSLAVKDLAGILDIKKHVIEVKCLPADLVPHIDVDISPLVDFNASIHVKDLNIPANMEVLNAPDESVVTAVPPRVEEAAPVAAAATAEGEGAATAEAGEAKEGGASEGAKSE